MSRRAANRPFPSFFGGPARAEIICALALHVQLTVSELLKVLGWKSPRTLYRLAVSLNEAGLVERFRAPSGRSGSRGRWHGRLLWALDRRNPWIWEIRAFARRLAKAMAIPGPAHIGLAKKRDYIGPAPALGHSKKKSPLARTPQKLSFPIYGQKGCTLILMFLPHLGYYSNGVPVRKLARLLGLSRYGVTESLNLLLDWEIIKDQWVGNEHLVKLNTRYLPYESLRKLLLRIDRDTGREFQYLASAYTRSIGKQKLRRYWAKKRGLGRSRKAR